MSTDSMVWGLTAATFAVTGVGVARMRDWGARRLLDHPNARSSHARPTPRGGGLPLVVVAVAAWVILLAMVGGLRRVESLAFLTSIVIVAAVSWRDDLRPLPFRTRLSAHLIAALIVVWAFPPPAGVTLPGIGALSLAYVRWPLALLWIAGLTNAYNFMDGIDGIAGGQGIVAGLAWWGMSLLFDAPQTGALGLFIAAGCAAFLCFNWAPASIFMGDVGAATLGFLFAAAPFVTRGAGSGDATASWAVAAAMVWPFVFDTGFTLVRRWRRGETLTDAHRSHLYQRLVIAGWGHTPTALLYSGWAATTAAAGWAMAEGYRWSGPAGLAWAAVSGVAVWRLVVTVEHRRGARG